MKFGKSVVPKGKRNQNKSSWWVIINAKGEICGKYGLKYPFEGNTTSRHILKFKTRKRCEDAIHGPDSFRFQNCEAVQIKDATNYVCALEVLRS